MAKIIKKDVLAEKLDGHDEPDGTGEHNIENQRAVPQGEDWLTWKPVEADAKPDDAPITSRVIDIGGTKLTLDESLSGKTLDELTKVLATTMPELKTGTVTETAQGGVSTISVKAKAGRKG